MSASTHELLRGAIPVLALLVPFLMWWALASGCVLRWRAELARALAGGAVAALVLLVITIVLDGREPLSFSAMVFAEGRGVASETSELSRELSRELSPDASAGSAPDPYQSALAALWKGLDGAFLRAAIPEESLKFLVLALLLAWTGWRPLDEAAAIARGDAGGEGKAKRGEPQGSTLRLGLFLGISVGLGFAALEALIYAVLRQSQTLGEAGYAGLARLITAVPCHAFLGGIMGCYLVLAMRSGDGRPDGIKYGAAFKAWVIPVLAHGLYNLPLLTDLPLPIHHIAQDESARFGGDLATAIADHVAVMSIESILLSCLVLTWLAAWNRQLLQRCAA